MSKKFKMQSAKCKIMMLGILCILASLVGAEEAGVSVGFDKNSIALGDSVTMTVTVRGMPNVSPPQIQSWPGFNVKYAGASREPWSSVTTIINGKVQTQNSGGGLSFYYAITPEKAGHHTVPSLMLSIGGKTYQTELFQLEVVEQSQVPRDIFLKVTANKNSVYLGQRVLVTFKWYFSQDISGYQCNVPWLESLKNFLVVEPEREPGKQYQGLVVNNNQEIAALKSAEDYRGKRYTVISFQRILVPAMTGNFTLEPSFLKCEVVKGYERQRDTFDDFFNGFGPFGRKAVSEPFSTSSNALELRVKSLPPGKPGSFTGAVGRFDFSVTVSPSQVKAGDPLTVTMKVKGQGNFDEIKAPYFPDTGAFQSYEPEIRTNVKQTGGDTTGEKIYDKTLIPRAKGAYTIPVISFSYFNPESESYKTVSLGPFPVEVEKGLPAAVTQTTPTQPHGPEEKQEIKIIDKDINYIKTELGSPRKIGNPIYQSLTFWTIGFIPPPLLALGCLLLQKRRMKLQTDVGYARHRLASKIARKRLKTCEKLLNEKKATEFYEEVSRAINSYLADKLNRTAAGITADIIAELEKKGVTGDVLGELKDCYETSDMAKFSGLTFGEPQMTETYNKVKKVISNLEEIL